MNPCLAIIDPNTLSAIGLKELLWDIFPEVEILSFASMEDFASDCDHYFVHYFVSSAILLEHSGEFEALKRQTIITHAGAGAAYAEAGYKVLDLSLPEEKLAAAILRLHREGHGGWQRESQGESTGKASAERKADLLSAREKDVLALMVKGYYNKEIADRLHISVTTAIFHRNNICEKLGTRSLGRLTIYALLNHVVDIDAIK